MEYIDKVKLGSILLVPTKKKDDSWVKEIVPAMFKTIMLRNCELTSSVPNKKLMIIWAREGTYIFSDKAIKVKYGTTSLELKPYLYRVYFLNRYDG
ncbi:hypothetical protein [Caldisericum sp.]|uniref:hypothetical protein n=1 Tax=Caldisericum sp. TaxID=2499687 RepID=UPI003D0CBFC4